MTLKVNMLKYLCFGLGLIWTLAIVINLARDFSASRPNHYGLFFGILTAAAVVTIGDLFFWLVYCFGKRFLK